MPTDAELLQRYVAHQAEDAFAELVQRHLNLVYAAALRRTGGRHALAEEIAQKVFTNLARQAVPLTSHPTLTGWLYRCTRNVAIDAVRVEQRREKLAHHLTTMPDDSTPTESAADLEQLRTVIDQAMDQLKEKDREVMLLRFFQGLSFGEVGARLNLSENTARMRTERALEKLRFHLGKRGITSTAALAGLLTSQSLVAAPVGLAASVTTTALAAPPISALAIFVTHFLMNKIALTSLSVALTTALTSVAWATLANNVSDRELAALRAENTRLTQATAAGAPAASMDAVAAEFATQANTIVQSVGKRLEQKNSGDSGKYHSRGQATPYDAFMSYAWAMLCVGHGRRRRRDARQNHHLR
jgi:RNA polymerase sigma factor (sigma-70 family)